MKNKGLKIAVGTMAAGLVAGGGYAGLQLQQWSAGWDRAAERGADATDPASTIAPELLTWQEVGRIHIDLPAVKSFALLKDGKVLVAGERMLRLLAADGQVLRDIPLATTPQAVAVMDTPEGIRFFAGLTDHVEVFDAAGAACSIWPVLGADSVLTCLAPGPSGKTLWVADAGRRVVAELDLAGRVLRQIGRQDPATHAPGLVVPSAHLDVAIAADGTAWINNPGRHELEGYDAAGVMVRQWGEFGLHISQFSGCCNPTDFFLLPDNRFVTAEKGSPRVKVFDSRGNLESVVTTDFASTAAGIDVAADSGGRIWILDPVSRDLRLFGPKARQP